MNRFVLLLLLASALFAADNFGGIGVALYKASRGVSIAAVAQGSPADEAGLQKGDCITAVDGVDLSKMKLSEVRNRIRSEPGKSLALSIIRESEIFNVNLQRVQMEVVGLNGVDSATSSDKVSALAKRAASEGYELLDIVQTKNQNTGIYIQKNVKVKFGEILSKTPDQGISLQDFSRTQITFELQNSSPIRIKIFAMDGSLLKKLNPERVIIGGNRFYWNGETLPSGQYTVQLEQGSVVSRNLIILK